LAVTEIGGHLSDVSFTPSCGRSICPMHVAPWIDEPLGGDIAPVLRILCGDFFCAPFSFGDLLPNEKRGHGLPANDAWRLTRTDASSLEAVLDGEVMGASVTKHVAVPQGETVVCQRHGLIDAPANFGAVADIRPVPCGVVLANASGTEIFTACDVAFVGRDSV